MISEDAERLSFLWCKCPGTVWISRTEITGESAEEAAERLLSCSAAVGAPRPAVLAGLCEAAARWCCVQWLIPGAEQRVLPSPSGAVQKWDVLKICVTSGCLVSDICTKLGFAAVAFVGSSPAHCLGSKKWVQL